MLDSQLIAAGLKSRRAWDIFAPYVDAKELTPPAQFWYGIMREWYSRDPQAPALDKSLLVEQGRQRIKNPKHVDSLLGFMSDLPDPPSPENVANVVLELKRHNAGMELASAIASNDHMRAATLHKKYGDLLSATTLQKRRKFEDAVGWNDLDALVGDDKRIKLAPKQLNEKAGGGALPGHSILLFGRPEMGKSSFAINMARGFLFTGQRVGYLGNEDNINVLKKRMRSRLSGMTQAEINRDPAKANRLAEKRERENGGELFMRHIHGGTMDDVNRFCDEFEPTVLIVDQLRNIKNGEGEIVRRLETAGQDLRDLLAQRGVVGVSVAQAGGSAEGSVWLAMDDIDSSKTGLPGTMDLIVGIGANEEMLRRNQRALSPVKNKLSDDPKNHEGFIVEVDLQRSKVNG
jgi:archaellum biogenesis ATPase FlaH